jgi:hypothetical protein
MSHIYNDERIYEMFELIKTSGQSKQARSKFNARFKTLGYTDNDVSTARILVYCQPLVTISGKVSKIIVDSHNRWMLHDNESDRKLMPILDEEDQSQSVDGKSLTQRDSLNEQSQILIKKFKNDLIIVLNKAKNIRLTNEDVIQIDDLLLQIDEYI